MTVSGGRSGGGVIGGFGGAGGGVIGCRGRGFIGGLAGAVRCRCIFIWFWLLLVAGVDHHIVLLEWPDLYDLFPADRLTAPEPHALLLHDLEDAVPVPAPDADLEDLLLGTPDEDQVLEVAAIAEHILLFKAVLFDVADVLGDPPLQEHGEGLCVLEHVHADEVGAQLAHLETEQFLDFVFSGEQTEQVLRGQLEDPGERGGG